MQAFAFHGLPKYFKMCSDVTLNKNFILRIAWNIHVYVCIQYTAGKGYLIDSCSI